MLGQVPPSSVQDDEMNSTPRHAVLGSEGVQVRVALGVDGADGKNILLRQFGKVVTTASRYALRRAASPVVITARCVLWLAKHFGPRSIVFQMPTGGTLVPASHALRMKIRAMAFSCCHSPLGHGVLDILLLRSCPDMGRVYAGRIVAGVTSLQVLEQNLVRDFVGSAMGRGLFTSIGHNKDAIPILAPSSEPRPALIGTALVNFRPKTRNVFRGIIGVHQGNLHTGFLAATPEGVSAPLGHSCAPIIPQLEV